MPYPPGHRVQTKAKIVESARRLFNLHGVDNVSLDRIMADVGLTHGAFYSYFTSKNDLYTEVLSRFFAEAESRDQWDGAGADLISANLGLEFVRAYLSCKRYNDAAICPMVALPTTAARNGENTKRVFESVFRAIVGLLERSLAEDGSPRRTKAHAIAALCMGGMVVSRAMANTAHADELREACMATALDLGGWQQPTKLVKP